MIHHYRSELAERERLKAKVRLLVGRAYRRGRDREIMRRAGFEITAEPGSWDAFDDHIFETFKPKVESLTGQGQEGSGPDSGALLPRTPTAPSHLTVLDGGMEDTHLAGGVTAAGRSDNGQALRHGDRPPVVAGDEQPSGHPSNFERQETP